MDDFDLNINKAPGNEDLDKPIPFDDDLDKPIPFDDADMSKASVSHSPLSLGGSSAAGAPKIEVPKPAEKKPAEKIVSSDRISGVKTFFTKLHPGAMEFLDEQMTNWLKDNPGLVVKRTNTATGMVQAKKTEPNIIIHIWY